MPTWVPNTLLCILGAIKLAMGTRMETRNRHRCADWDLMNEQRGPHVIFGSWPPGGGGRGESGCGWEGRRGWEHVAGHK